MTEVGATFADPVPWVCVALIAGALWAVRHSRLLAGLLGLCFAGLYILSVGPGADLVLRPLERAYLPLHRVPEEPIGAIVVLSGGDGWSADRPITSALSASSTDRLVEAVRVWRMLGEEPTLLMVGGVGTPGGQVEAPLMAQAAHALGVPERALSWEAYSRNTYENAVAVSDILGGESFVLVTSAFHMPRAMEAFHWLGMEPVPAPCGHAARLVHTGWDWFPRSLTLWRSAQGLREHIARLWYRLRHRTAS